MTTKKRLSKTQRAAQQLLDAVDRMISAAERLKQARLWVVGAS